MAILWCGGEDIDFPNGGTATIDTTAGHFRSGYARGALAGTGVSTPSMSSIFPGGAVTSAWLSARWYNSGTGTVPANQVIFGFGKNGTSKGLYIGTDTSTANKVALVTYDGSSRAQLASESGTSLAISTLFRVEMQVVNYGASATVNIYINGTQIITFTGDVTVAGMSDFDTVNITRVSGSVGFQFSEIMVASEDLRAFPGLVTLALTGDGTATDWTGTYSTINGTTISDATPNYTNTNDLDQQFDVTNLPTGAFDIRAVKIAARAAKAAGTPTQIALGYRSGGSNAVGSDIALTTAYVTYERLDSTNPVTTNPWQQSEMDALQIMARSKA